MATFMNICPSCSRFALFRELAPAAGTSAAIVSCDACAGPAVYHSCPRGVGTSWLLPVATSALTSACPTCGAVYDVSSAIASSPDMPAYVKRAALVVSTLALAYAAGRVLTALIPPANG